MKLAIIDDEGTVHTVIEGLEEYDLAKPFPRLEMTHEIQRTMDSLFTAAKPQPNKAMVEGGRYEVRHRSELQRRDRLSVMDYLGDDYTLSKKGHFVFSARHVAGIQHMPMDWVISLKQVPKSTPISMNKVVAA